MTKNNAYYILSADPMVMPTEELTKAIASELVYTEDSSCLEEIFKKGQKLDTNNRNDRTRDLRDDSKSG